ncbi:L-gulonolactone oxidase [Glycomyces algeriensis]|uniref:FAD-linked oxidoreductase n=1 Tax=Glycomyces algeriensis TaxID=256037 RepID=A0A9W6G888_9ACTN|nr:D-arabinono-1,4-lactone oxidase [Glycomyces algeriensis]MDA1365336.1 FAD-binding protein [Glycomyces algeriensis]MDR7349600.1 L-gulonolactone oxidase [Glycomyces algeriensis]GLI42306.1 FAD-linked oxidoreductase [Glycomyces algeriensis]
MGSSIWQNWSGTENADPARTVRPAGVGELAAAVTAAASDGLRVKAVGAGHSFSGIAVADGVQVDMRGLDQVVAVDPRSGLVTVEAGMPLWRLNQVLDAHGLALENMGDIDRQTISGAISTGTHGTGDRYRGFAWQVKGLKLVLADGSIVQCTEFERPELFAAARLGLGAVGVIAEVTLQCVPAFRLKAVERPERLDAVLDGLDELVSENDHFEFYWFPHTARTLTKLNNRYAMSEQSRAPSRLSYWWSEAFTENTLFEASNRVGARFPGMVPGLNRLAGRVWSAREYTDVSHRVFASPRSVVFREMEYAMPREALPGVLRELQAMVERERHLVSFPVEVRFAAADDIWLSTAQGRRTAYVAVHQYHRHDHVPYFKDCAAIFDAADGRPHWGKMHSLDAERLGDLYEHFDDFLAVRKEVDPDRRFSNPYLERVLGD